MSAGAPSALGNDPLGLVGVGCLEAVDVEGALQMVVFVLEDAREPPAGADLDSVAVHVVAAQDRAERAPEGVAVSGHG